MTGVGLCSNNSCFREIQRRKLKISCRRKRQLVVSYQVVTDPCCGLSVTINIPEIFSGVHGLTGKTVISAKNISLVLYSGLYSKLKNL